MKLTFKETNLFNVFSGLMVKPITFQVFLSLTFQTPSHKDDVLLLDYYWHTENDILKLQIHGKIPINLLFDACPAIILLTSYPACGGMDISLSPRVLPSVSHQDVPHHPNQLEDHETGDKGQQVLFLDRGAMVRDGQHQRRTDKQQIGPVLPAEDLCVLPRVVP